MNILYPSDESLASLREQPGVQSWRLEENFRTSQVSRSLREPLACFTPGLRISGCQWFFQVPSCAKVVLQSGLLQLNDRTIYETNQANARENMRLWHRTSSLPPGWWHRSRVPRLCEQPLLLLSTHNNSNYFHWLTQPGLAPLFLQDHFGLSPLPGLALGVSHRPRRSLPSFVPSMLEVFEPSLPVVQGVALASQSLCRFAVQEHKSEVVVSPAHLHWLKRRCLEKLQRSPKPWRRVLVSRQRSRRRRCLNEDQLLAALTPYGFKRYFLEELSVLQQLRLFSETAVLVGAHGAGLTNLLACVPRTALIELIPRPGAFSHYYVIADVLGISHGHLLASYCDPKTDDFAIDSADVLNLLMEMELL